MHFDIDINGTRRSVDVDPDTPLLWALRDELHLTGTKYGCGAGICGACTVLIGGVVARSCSVAVEDIGDQPVQTIEGLSDKGSHPLQQAWLAENVPQCGYCQSGMLMAAASLLATTPHPTDEDIDAAMTNICRCGTYPRVRKAILRAAAMTEDAK